MKAHAQLYRTQGLLEVPDSVQFSPVFSSKEQMQRLPQEELKYWLIVSIFITYDL